MENQKSKDGNMLNTPTFKSLMVYQVYDDSINIYSLDKKGHE